MEQRGYVGVVGPGAGAGAGQVRLAEEVGALLAAERLVVVTGGLDGVMAGAARGCELAGGTSIGLLPGGAREAGNPYSTVTLPTGLGELRNGLLVRASDVLVAIAPSWGTLSEVAVAVRTGVPVVLLAWDPAVLDGLPPSTDPAPLHARTPQEAVRLVVDHIGDHHPPEEST